MKLEQSEKMFVEHLFRDSVRSGKIDKMDSFGIVKLTGDASTRRYYRVTGSKGRSYVICLDTPREIENQEYPFYNVQDCLNKSKIRVPDICDIDLSKGYVLEEDLGDETFLSRLSKLKTLDEEYELYRQAIDILVAIQKIPMTQIHHHHLEELAFDREKLMYEFRFTIDYFLQKLLKINITPAEHELLLDSFEKISDELASLPMVLAHRDFHSRNLMMKNDELVVIDFQDARMGIPQYDLVSLLEDCYYSVKRGNKEKLFEYYQKKMGMDKQVKQEEFLRIYRLMTIQRVFKAIGSFAYIYNSRGDIRYLKHIGFAMENVKRKLMYFPEFSDLRSLLMRYYYEN